MGMAGEFAASSEPSKELATASTLHSHLVNNRIGFCSLAEPNDRRP
jgi:hypothetical protein